MTSQQGKIRFLQKQLVKMLNVKNHLDLYVHAIHILFFYFSYVNLRSVQEIFFDIKLMHSKLYKVFPVVTSLIINQDGGWQVTFVFEILKAKEATRNLTNNILISSKVVMDQPEKKYIAISL